MIIEVSTDEDVYHVIDDITNDRRVRRVPVIVMRPCWQYTCGLTADGHVEWVPVWGPRVVYAVE